MKVLVCGGRDYTDQEALFETLNQIDRETPITEIIEGGARGADLLARDWAVSVGRNYTQFDANWEKYGRRAGPLRNAEMLRLGRPDLVVAFPGGRGTANMIAQATKARIRVIYG